jgi:hypothetical protein
MKISDLAPILYELYAQGWGDVELYTHWEDFKGKPVYPEFHLYLNGMNQDDFMEIYPHNPFNNPAEVHSFGISKEMSFHETGKKGCCKYDPFEIYEKIMKDKEYVNGLSTENK